MRVGRLEWGCSPLAGLRFPIHVSRCRAQALGHRLQEMGLVGLVVPGRVGSFQTWDQTGVPCIVRWIRNHWPTSDLQETCF